MSHAIFRLICLELFDHKVLGNLRVDFVKKSYTNLTARSAGANRLDDPFVTLVIGPNGSGKSAVLGAISDVFREVYRAKENGDKYGYSSCSYSLKYELGDAVYQITRRPGQTREYEKNGKVIDVSELAVPARLIVSSFVLNDRFAYAPYDRNGYYQYLGIRSSNSSASTKTYLKRVTNNLLQEASEPEFIRRLGRTLEFIGLKQYFRIRFWPKFANRIYKNELTQTLFEEFFDEWKSRRTTPPYSLSFFNKLRKDNPEKIAELVQFINDARNNSRGHDGTTLMSGLFSYDLFSESGKQKSSADFDKLRLLQALDLVYAPEFEFIKQESKQSSFGIADVSSGEIHILTTVISILANIKDNSLVLIDEPEISLHPEWQTKYVNFLKTTCEGYNSCHFIMASHSHFMVSDLRKESSSIIVLSRGAAGDVSALFYPADTYGWTAEDVLYTVFKVPTVRNYYLAEEVGNLLGLIANGNDADLDEIRQRVRKLKIYVPMLKEVDPFKEIIEKLVSWYELND